MKSLTFKVLAATLALSFGAASAIAAEPSPELAKEITASLSKSGGAIFPIGKENLRNVKNFTGPSFVAPLGGDKEVGVANVTFGPGVINRWHVHPSSCQVLIAESGRGYVQIWGQEPVELKPGVIFTVPANTKHWHGAAPGTWFQHIAVMRPSKTEWLEPVDPGEYQKLR